MALERRKERRIKAHLPIKIICPDNLEVLTRTENISFLGTYVETDKKIPSGTKVEIVLELPPYDQDVASAGEIQAQGDVFRCGVVNEGQTSEYYGVGIFFTTFHRQEDMEKLHRFIDFLAVREEHDIHEGVKRLKNKRQAHKIMKETEQLQLNLEEYHHKVIELLSDISSKLEEISETLKTQDK